MYVWVRKNVWISVLSVLECDIVVPVVSVGNRSSRESISSRDGVIWDGNRNLTA